MSWTNIGTLKSPSANIDAMCRRCVRISSVETLSFGVLRRDLDRAAGLLDQKVVRRLLLVEAHALVRAIMRLRRAGAGRRPEVARASATDEGLCAS